MLQFWDINVSNTWRSKQRHQAATHLESRDCQRSSQQFQPPRALHARRSAHPGSCPLCLWWLLGREQHLNTQQWTSVSLMQTFQQNGASLLIIIVIKDICDAPAILSNTTALGPYISKESTYQQNTSAHPHWHVHPHTHTHTHTHTHAVSDQRLPSDIQNMEMSWFWPLT